MYYITGCDVSNFISLFLHKTHQYFFDLIRVKMKVNDGWKIRNKKKEKEKAGHNKEEFWEEKMFLRNLIWNVDRKQYKVNDAAVKIIFIVKNAKYQWLT